MTTMETLKQLSDEDRRTLILAIRYELARKYDAKCPQWQYRVFFETEDFRRVVQIGGDEDKRTKAQIASDYRKFKQFEDVRKWLEKDGWTISLKMCAWQGYVKYLFKRFGDSMPTPLQLKNPFILAAYMKTEHVEDKPKPRRTAKQLSKIYKQVVAPQYL